MEYKDNDDEIIYLVKENDDNAKDYLVNKYQNIVDIIIKKYKRMAYLLKVDNNDLYQEAMLGFADALDKYDEKKDASLKTFISLCVERRLQNVIKKASTKKNKVMNESLSLDNQQDDDSNPFIDFLSDNNLNNPLSTIEQEENYQELTSKINSILSDSEIEVYNLLINGLNYNDIAILLDKSSKQVDNTIQRLRNKIKKIV